MVHHYGGRPGFALLNAEFTPDGQRAWRWVTEGPRPRTVVKFELLTDQDDMPRDATVTFDGCDDLGAAEINVTGLAGFLLAKAAAARSRRKPKDWYDIAYVLLHNDAGGPEEAATAVLKSLWHGDRGLPDEPCRLAGQTQRRVQVRTPVTPEPQLEATDQRVGTARPDAP